MCLAGKGAPRTPDRLKDRLCLPTVEHHERILQARDWDLHVRRNGAFEESDEAPECAERTDDALAITISLLFELCVGFAQPFEEETEARIQRAQIGLFDFLWKSAIG